jgi:hypothetical protein
MLKMPERDRQVLARRGEIAAALRCIAPDDGALPLSDGVLLGEAGYKKVPEIGLPNRCALVQPGVAKLSITEAVQDQDFYYASAPSSQIACTVGGNVAENSADVHCLKYGLTTNNVIDQQIVTVDGEVLRLGGSQADSSGYDLLGAFVGSAGLLGVVTEVTVRRLLTIPPPAPAAPVLGISRRFHGQSCFIAYSFRRALHGRRGACWPGPVRAENPHHRLQFGHRL